MGLEEILAMRRKLLRIHAGLSAELVFAESLPNGVAHHLAPLRNSLNAELQEVQYSYERAFEDMIFVGPHRFLSILTNSRNEYHVHSQAREALEQLPGVSPSQAKRYRRTAIRNIKRQLKYRSTDIPLLVLDRVDPYINEITGLIEECRSTKKSRIRRKRASRALWIIDSFMIFWSYKDQASEDMQKVFCALSYGLVKA